jgi:hypothetical protein
MRLTHAASGVVRLSGPLQQSKQRGMAGLQHFPQRDLLEMLIVATCVNPAIHTPETFLSGSIACGQVGRQRLRQALLK